MISTSARENGKCESEKIDNLVSYPEPICLTSSLTRRVTQFQPKHDERNLSNREDYGEDAAIIAGVDRSYDADTCARYFLLMTIDRCE